MAEKRKLEQDVAEFLKDRFRSPRQIPDMKQHISNLLSSCKEMEKTYDFKRGDVIIWKKGLKNKARPSINEPIVVLEILEKPIFDVVEKGASSPYFQEPLDLVAGLVDEDGDFIIFHYDKRRFEPYQEQN